MEAFDYVAVASRLRWLAEVYERMAATDNDVELGPLRESVDRAINDIVSMTCRSEFVELRFSLGRAGGPGPPPQEE
ncbi:MAG: hypothetical protein JOZ99_06870 [Actinobacteria bacterium]|nr:hypothetical protein [Actinomycetota bacterium]